MEKVLTVIATTTDADKLRAMDANTKRIHGETHVIRSAIAARLLFLCGPNGIVGNEFEEVRQALMKVQGSDGRMSILLKNRGSNWRYRASDALPGIEPDSAFRGLAQARMPSLEAIVCRHPQFFSAQAVAEARKRMGDAP